MKTLWKLKQAVFTKVGSLLGWYLGGLDGFVYALIAFVVVDYITGILRTIVEKKFIGLIEVHSIIKKMAIFLVVGITHLSDMYLLGDSNVLRVAVIIFYISNEGLSLLENIIAIGLPIPDKLKEVLAQLYKKY